jgi:chromosome transmission fidelity protein 4
MCFTSEDGEDSNIEVNFHDVTVHHSMHINNFLHHTMAALSTEALVLATPASDEDPSKIVVVTLQGMQEKFFILLCKILFFNED